MSDQCPAEWPPPVGVALLSTLLFFCPASLAHRQHLSPPRLPISCLHSHSPLSLPLFYTSFTRLFTFPCFALSSSSLPLCWTSNSSPCTHSSDGCVMSFIYLCIAVWTFSWFCSSHFLYPMIWMMTINTTLDTLSKPNATRKWWWTIFNDGCLPVPLKLNRHQWLVDHQIAQSLTAPQTQRRVVTLTTTQHPAAEFHSYSRAMTPPTCTKTTNRRQCTCIDIPIHSHIPCPGPMPHRSSVLSTEATPFLSRPLTPHHPHLCTKRPLPLQCLSHAPRKKILVH